MAQQRRKSSNTQLAELNATLMAQNNKLDATARVAEEANSTTRNIQGELYRQRGVIEDNIEKNREVKGELRKANRKANQMRRRNCCIKFGLYLLILVLFAANIALIVWKVA